MRKAFSAAVALALTIFATVAGAEDAIPENRLVLQKDFDLPGGDLGPVFDISQPACVQACLSNTSCTALTYNIASRACFPKANPDQPIPFEGALSGQVLTADPIIRAHATERLKNAGDWLRSHDRTNALRQASRLGQEYPGYGISTGELSEIAFSWSDSSSNPEAIRSQAALVAITDSANDWFFLARRFNMVAENTSSNTRELHEAALSAATNSWLRDTGGGAPALAIWAETARKLGRGRDGLQALYAGPQDHPAIASIIDDFEGKYGFRIQDHDVVANGPQPRLCVDFSDNVARNTDLRPYVDLPDPTLGIEVRGDNLCITGVTRGSEIAVTMRRGLPAATGEILRRDVALTAYIPDRNPTVRFPGRTYVLPASGDLGLTLYTVNTDEAELTLYRMSDRNLVSALRDEMFGTPLQGWRESRFTAELGEQVWKGFAGIAPPTGSGSHPVNAEVATRLDLRAEAGPLQPGIYALKAAIPEGNEDVSPSATQWFMVSDLGLSSYSGSDGLAVVVRGLSDADTRLGIEVALVSRGNAVLSTATTDGQGIARFDAGLTRGRDAAEPALITATRLDGDRIADLSFLSLMDPEFDLSDRGVEGNPPAPPIDVFASLDRGAYRAGETAHATILTRNARTAAIDELPLRATVLRPDGAEYTRLMPAPAGDGGYVLNVPIPATASRGTWRIDLRVEEDGPALASMPMLVEDFLPERIDFDLDLGDQPLAPDTEIISAIQARWLYGAPAAELPVEGEMMLRPAHSLPGWDGYSFGRHDDNRSQTAQMIAGWTDVNGNYTASIRLPATMADTLVPMNAELRLNVLEGAGRPVERRDTALVLPAQAIPGIKPAFDDMTVPEGGEAQFSVIALGPDLIPQQGEFEWQLNRIDTDYQWYSIDGDWQWEPVIQRDMVASGLITLSDTGPVPLSVAVEWGEFELVVKSANGAETSIQFYAGWGTAASAKDTPDRLRVTLDKPAYRHGETATVTFDAPADGAATVSVMSNRLIAMQTVTVREGNNTVSLPVTDEWGAGVYVAVTTIRPVGKNAGHAPIRALGLAPASIDPADKLLQVAFDAPVESDPRKDTHVTLNVTGAEAGETIHATIWAVDQGILNITGYQPPSATSHYFGKRRLGVGLRDLYGRLILASGASNGAIRSGGDVPAAAAAAPAPTEKLMAWFSGPVTLDANGKAQVAISLPDFNGEVRLMAIAWTGKAVGQADTTILVRDPVVMTVTAPAFMSPGDTARMSLDLTHVSGPAGEVSLSLMPDADGITISTSGLPDTVSLTEGERLPLAITLDAPQTEGPAGIRITAVLPDGRSITKDLQIPVSRQDQTITRSMRITINPGENLSADITKLGSFHPGSGRVSMSVGAYALLDIPAVLTLLRNFSYGCTEQIASAAIPQLYAAGLMPDTTAPDRFSGSGKNMDQAISRIMTRQTPRGGFGLWNARNSEAWLDAFVTDFLSRSRTAGHNVPEANFNRALNNLQSRMNTASDPEYISDHEAAALAYAAYVLAREGRAVVSDLRYYADAGSGSFNTPMSAAQLGAALAFIGDQPRADRMFGHAARLLAKNDDPSGLRRDFGTLLRDQAAVLALAVEAGSERINREALASQIANGIADRNGRGGLSTQEAMWTVLAAQALASGDDSGQGITLGNTALNMPVIDLGDIGAPLDQPIGNQGNRPVNVTISATAIPAEPVSAGGTAYAIFRRYFTPDGETVDPSQVTQGQRMVAVLEITPFEDTSGRLIITDPLPAGFEIDNPNLIETGELDGLDWYKGSPSTEMSEFRADRFAASLEHSGEESFQLAYRLRAVTTGEFHHPAATVSDFYRPDQSGWTASGTVVVTP